MIVDFTHPGAALDNVRFAIDHGIAAVVGTSGFDAARLDTVRGWLAARPGSSRGPQLRRRRRAGHAVRPPGRAVLRVGRGDRAAPRREGRRPVRYRGRTADRIAQPRGDAGPGCRPDATTQEVPGARGADIDGIRVHGVRLPGLVAHQEVLFGTDGETLTIRHDSFDRVSFMPGVLLAVRRPGAAGAPPLGLEPLLGLD